MKIGDRARVLRRDMKLKQPQFVALLREHLPSVQEKAYSSWEAGTTPENQVDVAIALEKISGVPWSWFLRGIYVDGDGPDGGNSQETHEKITFALPRGRNNVTSIRALQVAA